MLPMISCLFRGVEIVDLLESLLNIARLNRLLHLHPVRDGRQVNVRLLDAEPVGSVDEALDDEVLLDVTASKPEHCNPKIFSFDL